MITINDRLIGSIDAVNVANDKEVIRLDFKCKNQVTELLKLTDCDAVYINYQNGSVKDRYLVTDLTADGEWVTFSWLLGKNATRAHGKTFFIVCAQITENDEIVQEWNTELAFFDVRKGLETVTAPSEPLEDIFTQLVEMINAKLEPSNIKAGQNVTVAVSGNDVTISATGGSGDAYTKAETDALLADKQDKGDYATETALGAEETARQNADASLQLQINAKAQQRRTLYIPTAAAVAASSIADGVYEATAAFTLIINPNAADPQTVTVNAGDLFYVKVESVSPYCRGFVLGDDMTVFTYPDSDEGVTISRITDYNSVFLGIFADLDNKADTSALAAKQDLLVSGTNIKTLNGQSLLGSGNLAVQEAFIPLDLSVGTPPSPVNPSVLNTNGVYQVTSGGYIGVVGDALELVAGDIIVYADGSLCYLSSLYSGYVDVASGGWDDSWYPLTAEIDDKIDKKADKVAYSTSEKVIGKWINNKPLYEKTVVFDFLDASGSNVGTGTTIGIGASNIDECYIINQFFVDNTSGVGPTSQTIVPMYNYLGSAIYGYYSIVDGAIKLQSAANFAKPSARDVRKLIFIVRYTKTTDSAN